MVKIGSTTMEVGDDGVAIITIVHPPENCLSIDVLQSLLENFLKALERNDVKAIVFTGDQGNFSGGLDMTAFDGIQEENCMLQHPIVVLLRYVFTERVEASKKPVVAAIDGLTFGGGLEIAMACHARISTHDAKLGFPEVDKFGIIPGFGGTQRLPRLVGISNAVKLLLGSRTIKGTDTHSWGLVDRVVPRKELLNTARRWALDIADGRKAWVQSLYDTRKLEPLQKAIEILNLTREQAKRQSPNLRHLLVCIDVIEEGITSRPEAGLEKEANAFNECLRSATCKSLVHILSAKCWTSMVPGVTDRSLAPRKIRKIAVFNGGLMGSKIALSLILQNYRVILIEKNKESLQKSTERVKAYLQGNAQGTRMVQEKFKLLEGAFDYEKVGDVDVVIQAATDVVQKKQQIFSGLEWLLASNTSRVDLNLDGQRTWCQHEIVNAYFFRDFRHARVMPLLEIAVTQKTSPQVVLDVLDLAKKIKKIPVIVRNCTRSAVNRMFFPYTQAAMLLVEQGTDLYKIDRALETFGLPLGPFRLADLVGFGEVTATMEHYVARFPARTYKSDIVPLMQKLKREGTTSKGFYLYHRGQTLKDDKIEEIIKKARKKRGVVKKPEFENLSEEQIREMILFPVVNEACRILAEGVATRASDLDIASVEGMGFPSYRGGIMFWADMLGPKHIHSRLDEWSKLNRFFKPCEYLTEKAAYGVPLSSGPTGQARCQLSVKRFPHIRVESNVFCHDSAWLSRSRTTQTLLKISHRTNVIGIRSLYQAPQPRRLKASNLPMLQKQHVSAPILL